jgi:hypothetical protein
MSGGEYALDRKKQSFSCPDLFTSDGEYPVDEQLMEVHNRACLAAAPLLGFDPFFGVENGI